MTGGANTYTHMVKAIVSTHRLQYMSNNTTHARLHMLTHGSYVCLPVLVLKFNHNTPILLVPIRRETETQVCMCYQLVKTDPEKKTCHSLCYLFTETTSKADKQLEVSPWRRLQRLFVLFISPSLSRRSVSVSVSLQV